MCRSVENYVEMKRYTTVTNMLDILTRNHVNLLVHAYVVMSKVDTGRFIKLQKTDLMSQLIDTDIDLKKFTYETSTNTVFIDGYIN